MAGGTVRVWRPNPRRLKVSACGVLVAAAVIPAVPTVASAHRPASRAEKAAMQYRAGSHYDHQSAKDVDVPNAFPLRCAVADIATVVKGSRWGAWIFNSRLKRDPVCARWASNGWTIEHRIGRRWYVVAEGSEVYTGIPGVPQRIAADLLKGLG